MSEDFWLWATIIVLIGGMCFGIKSCSDYENTPEYRLKQQNRLNECNTPRLVSEIDGVKLYVVKPECGREVYFSKSGTHTIHTERHGKMAIIYSDNVSNSEVNQ